MRLYLYEEVQMNLLRELCPPHISFSQLRSARRRTRKRRMSPSGMWRCVDLALTDVSDERIAFIFRVEKSASGEPA
jgi:hypothetical protein